MWYLALYGVFALWVLVDAIARKLGVVAVVWAIGTLVLGPLVLPVYLAKRPLKNGEVREGGTGWNVLKNFAILWTIAMAIASFASLMAVGKLASTMQSDAERAGAGFGMLLGMGLLAALWFLPTMGAAVLGFLLKKNSIVEKGPTGPLVGQNSQTSAATGWAGVVGASVLGLIIVGITGHAGADSATSKSSSATAGQSAGVPSTQQSDDRWTENSSVNEMDNTKQVTLILKADNDVQGFIGSTTPSLIIRCMKNSTDAYISLGTQVEVEYGATDSAKVRVKYDDGSPIGERWQKATSGDALFSPAATTFAKKLATSQAFMFEFTPFQKSEETVTFNVRGLDKHLGKVASACGWQFDAAQN